MAKGVNEVECEMPKENDLEGLQDQGGKHGGQAGMPTPGQSTPTKQAESGRDRKGDIEGDPSTRRTTSIKQRK
jgi:hypothetical protein